LELRADDGRELHTVIAQPKRQALLIYLAVAQPSGFHRRETLLGLFWPELDDAHARAALSRAIHSLRAAMGSEIVLRRGYEEVGLDWSRFWCDAAGFEAALDRGELAEAMALYRGELLPGFYVDDAGAFENWFTRERARLNDRSIQAARMLSEREQMAGRTAPAIEWARRAVALAPLDESAARALLTLLYTAGDRAGALREYEELCSRLQAELEVEPDTDTQALAAAIRAGERPRAAPAPSASDAATPAAPVPDLPPAPRPGPSPAVQAPPPLPAAPRRLHLTGWTGVALALLAMASIAVVGNRASWWHRPVAEASAGASVAVVPFVVSGDSSVRYLSDGMVGLLSERFNHAGRLRAVDARAVLDGAHQAPPSEEPARVRALVRPLRPRFVVAGSVSERGDSVTLNAVLLDSASGTPPVARGAVSGPAADVGRLTDALAWQLATAATQPAGTPLQRGEYASLTPSLDALKDYLAGDAAYAAGRFADAVRDYHRAVEADTTFALAYYWLSRAANWSGDQATSTWAVGRAMEYVNTLSSLDQFAVRAWDAYAYGNVDEARRYYELALANANESSDLWFMLGELRFHWGPLLGWSLPDTRQAFENAYAIRWRNAATLVHLSRLATVEGRTQVLDSLVRVAGRLGVDSAQALELRGLQAFATGDTAAQRQVVRATARLDEAGAFTVALMVGVYASASPRAGDITNALAGPGRSAQTRAVATLLDAELAMAHGNRGRAMDILRSASGAALTPRRALEYQSALATLPFAAPDPDNARRLRNALLAVPRNDHVPAASDGYDADGIFEPRRQYLIAMLDLQLSDTTAALDIAARLAGQSARAGAHSFQDDMRALIRASVLAARNQADSALSALGPPHVLPNRVLPAILEYPEAHARYLRAELLHRLGRDREARAWFETFPDPGGYDVMYLRPVSAGLAEVNRALGVAGPG
jgi:serine/threonine-protein kinase